MRTILVFTLSIVILLTGCSAAWVSTLDSILAVAAPALVNILQIVAVANGQPLNSSLTTKINSDALAIRTLADDFAIVSSSSAPGVCQELQAAISTYQTDQQLVLQIAQVSDTNTQTKISLLAGLAVATVQAITAVIPSCQSAPSAHAFKAQPSLKVQNFVSEYNAILKIKTGNPAVDALSQKLTLHEHSKVVRVLTLGRLH